MKILGFILLLISSNCFLIYEKIPLDTYVGKVREELKEILSLRTFENIQYEDYVHTKDQIQYTLSQVAPKFVYFNSYMPSATVSTSPELSITFSWLTNFETNYISPYHLIYTAELSSSGQKYQIQFELESAEFYFTKRWELYEADQFYIPNGSISNEYSSFKAKCLDSKCPYTTELLLEVISGFLSKNKAMMNEELSKGVESYYKSIPFEENAQKIYTSTSSNIPNENTLDLMLESAPEYSESNKIFIFKRKGTLNGQTIQQGSTIDSDTINQSFNLDSRIYNTLISENLFDIKFEQSSNPATKYELTVEYLKQVVELNETYPDSTELKLEAIMKDVALDATDPFKGIVSFEVSLISRDDLTTLFAFDLKLEFKFIVNLFQNGINWALVGKNLKINDFKTDYEVLDINLLGEWIENTYLCSLGNNEFDLLALPLDLSHYFKGNNLRWEFNGDYLSIIKN